MKKYLFIFILMFFASGIDTKAQKIIVFGYDNAGNRISRTDSTQTPVANDKNNNTNKDLIEPEKKLLSKLTEGKIRVYPNPTERNLLVRFENFESIEGITILLFNSSGSLLKQKVTTADLMEFDMSAYSPGIYILRLIKGQEKREYKIIKK